MGLKEPCNREYSLLFCYLLLITPKLLGQNLSLEPTALARHWQKESGMSMAKQRVAMQLALTCVKVMVHT